MPKAPRTQESPEVHDAEGGRGGWGGYAGLWGARVAVGSRGGPGQQALACGRGRRPATWKNSCCELHIDKTGK